MDWISPGGPRYRAPYGANNYLGREKKSNIWQGYLGVLLSDNLTWTERGFAEGSMRSTMRIEEASATKDEVVKDAAEEAAQAEGIFNTILVPHLEVVSS